MPKPFRFIDLFAGIGGFHHALEDLGGRCVLTVELDAECRQVYQTSFPKMKPRQIVENIRSLTCAPGGEPLDLDEIASRVPAHDVLCAGFPCQPFSKSGSQQGFNDLTRGTLFHEIMRIVRESKPKILLLENVPNLHTHDDGNTFEIIKASIEEEGYHFSSAILSPHEFGTPQIRKRLYMVAIKQEYCREEEFQFPKGYY